MDGPAKHYRGYGDLTNAQIEDTDYRVRVHPVASSSIAVIAPHGGSIEQFTSDIALALAGQNFNHYLFEGIRRSGNYAALHLTSHRFDEPRCLALLAQCDHVIAVHGCGGDKQQALVGGLDEPLKVAMVQAISALGIDTRIEDHRFPASDSMNICNRGRRGVGVQIELTMPLRLRGPRAALVSAIRSVLLKLD